MTQDNQVDQGPDFNPKEQNQDWQLDPTFTFRQVDGKSIEC
jgi:hypothetical protein